MPRVIQEHLTEGIDDFLTFRFPISGGQLLLCPLSNDCRLVHTFLGFYSLKSEPRATDIVTIYVPEIIVI